MHVSAARRTDLLDSVDNLPPFMESYRYRQQLAQHRAKAALYKVF
jgi:hypothetical protein